MDSAGTRLCHFVLASALVLGVTSGVALGAIYKWEDSTGRVQLSDQPPKDIDAELLHVNPSNINNIQSPPMSEQSGLEGAGSTSATIGTGGIPRQEGALGGSPSAGSSSTPAAAVSMSEEKSPSEIARENRKIRQARRDRCNDSLGRLLARDNATRVAAPSDDLRKELRENCK